jgi:hypothetical protein
MNLSINKLFKEENEFYYFNKFKKNVFQEQEREKLS